MLETINLSTRIQNFYLNNISISVPENSIHVILGPSGSGKTVLLETIAGFNFNVKNLSGQIKLNGTDITNFPAEKRNFSYVPQDLALFPHLNVEDNIFFSHKIKNPYNIVSDTNNFINKEFVTVLANNIGVISLFKRNINSLSGGERQRVALVRALATGNRHLLLDEPFNGLHPGMRKELWFLLKEMQEKYKLTIIMITHDLEEAFFLGDFISVLIDGQIEQSESKQKARIPKTLAVAKLYGLKNIFNAKIDKSSGMSIINIPELKICFSEKQLQFSYNEIGDKNRHENKVFKIGIRSEDIILYDPENTEAIKKINPEILDMPTLKGKITSYFEKDHSALILFKPDNANVFIEAELVYHKARKLYTEVNKLASLAIDTKYIFPIFV
ncbi:MAG: ABC transporter ATP-binding protein [Oligoflexia bacterium]|nr:ABC transporter ATP-binding protein [Oligoflexia bacterium]